MKHQPISTENNYPFFSLPSALSPPIYCTILISCSENSILSIPVWTTNTDVMAARGINVAFIDRRNYFLRVQYLLPPTPHHAIPTFLVPVLLDFLELRCQGKASLSPFQTHPKTIAVSIVSLLLYCLAFHLELGFPSTRNFAPARAMAMVFGWLCWVCLASILLPDSARLVLYLVYAVLLASEFLQSQLQRLWKWIQQTTIGNFLREVCVKINRGWSITSDSENRGSLLPL